jgi:hypothetical protein
MWGLHFSSLPRPAKKSDDRIIHGLLANYFLWVKTFATTKDRPEIKRNCVADPYSSRLSHPDRRLPVRLGAGINAG